MPVRVQVEDFDVARELAALRGGDARVGAVAAFIGTVRDVNEASTVAAITLEHYPGMTEKALAAIVVNFQGSAGATPSPQCPPGRPKGTDCPLGGQRAK